MSGWHVELEAVSKTYGSVRAVDSVSIRLKKGEFLTLLGPSGCGKTTTLRMVAGFVSPTSGDIFIKGGRVNDTPPYVRNTGMVFQNYALFPHLTVYENIAFGLRMRKVKENDIARRVKDALELVQLSGMERRFPKQLSGGQQQRIALARALVVEPDVLLLDEPLSNLDLKLRQSMRLEIKAIQKRLGITTIYVTHDQGEALVMSDNLAVMNKGKVMQTGSPAEVYERPANQFVAQFIGEANILSGSVKSSTSDIVEVMIADEMVAEARIQESTAFRPGMTVQLSVRPERIQISKNTVEGRNVFRGRIEEVVYIGSDVRYHVRVGSNSLLVDDKVEGIDKLHKQGETVFVHWDPNNSVLLPLS